MYSKEFGLEQYSVSQILWQSKSQSCFGSQRQPLCIIYVHTEMNERDKTTWWVISPSASTVFDKDAGEKCIFVLHKKSSYVEVKTAQLKHCI